jgi:hypothetical protein
MLCRIILEILFAQQLIRVNIRDIMMTFQMATLSLSQFIFIHSPSDVFCLCERSLRVMLMYSLLFVAAVILLACAKRITINNWHEPRMLIILGDDHDGWQNTTNSRYTSKNAGNFPYKFYVDSYQLIAFKGKGNSFLLGCENHPSTTHHQPQSTPPHPLQYFSFKNI